LPHQNLTREKKPGEEASVEKLGKRKEKTRWSYVTLSEGKGVSETWRKRRWEQPPLGFEFEKGFIWGKK